jgi:hypothetical protein
MDERRKSATATAGMTVRRQEALVNTIQAAVAEAVADHEERALIAAQSPAKKRASMSAFLLVVLVGFLASGLYSYFEIRKMGTPIDEELGMEVEAAGMHLYSVAMRLEQFKQENGHYPASLDRMGLPVDETLEYKMISDTEYSMTFTCDNITRSFHSGQPLSRLLQK